MCPDKTPKYKMFKSLMLVRNQNDAHIRNLFQDYKILRVETKE